MTKYLQRAIDKQLKSQAADEALEKGQRGTIATQQQIVGSRRRADDIIIDVIDGWSGRTTQVKTKKSGRKRRRGPRSIKYYRNPIINQYNKNCL